MGAEIKSCGVMTRPLVPVTWKQAADRHIKVKKRCTRTSTCALKKEGVELHATGTTYKMH